MPCNSILWYDMTRQITTRHNITCYTMLCYAMLCYAMLCYAMLCYDMIWYHTIPYHTIRHGANTTQHNMTQYNITKYTQGWPNALIILLDSLRKVSAIHVSRGLCKQMAKITVKRSVSGGILVPVPTPHLFLSGVDKMRTEIAKFMGPTWDPPGSCRPQMCPMLAPWTLLLGDLCASNRYQG